MLYAKINPKASSYKLINPITPELVEVDYMGIYARRYGMGSSSSVFDISFGNIVFDVDNNPVYFELKSRTYMNLSEVEMVEWGVDDKALMNVIATRLGTNIIEFINVNDDKIIGF